MTSEDIFLSILDVCHGHGRVKVPLYLPAGNHTSRKYTCLENIHVFILNLYINNSWSDEECMNVSLVIKGSI